MPLLSDLTHLLGAGAVLTEAAEVAGYVEDWRGRYRRRGRCVVLPSTHRAGGRGRARLRAQPACRCCRRAATPACAAAPCPTPTGPRPVIVSLARMRRIRSIDAANNSMDVEAGCVLASHPAGGRRAGRLYPVSLGAEGSCQIGGNIATNAGGTGVLRYGNTRDNVLGLEVVLPDGRIWDGLYRLRKNNTGLDLKHLFIGSEGTLGIITGRRSSCIRCPAAHATAWLAWHRRRPRSTMLGRFQQRAAARSRPTR